MHQAKSARETRGHTINNFHVKTWITSGYEVDGKFGQEKNTLYTLELLTRIYNAHVSISNCPTVYRKLE